MKIASRITLLVLFSLTTITAEEILARTESEAATFTVEDMHAGSTYVVLCAGAGGEKWLGVARRLAAARQARALVVFDTEQPGDLLPLLTELAPENVAYVIPPQLISPHLAGELAELSSRIRPDKLIDYASGYITGTTAEDALSLIERTLEAQAEKAPIPRVCTGVGHSWYDMSGPYLILASRETGRGPTLTLTDAEGASTVLPATADVTIVASWPDQSYQVPGVARRLMVSPPDGARCLIRFDLGDSARWKHATLTIPVDTSRWKFEGQMVLGVSSLQKPWNESVATWNDAPAFDRETKAIASVDGTTTTVTVDVTSQLNNMEHGVAVFCHSTEGKTAKPLRHMYHFMARYVNDCRTRGFDGTAIEALSGDEWTRNHIELLTPMSQGGLILFGGHGSGSVSCLVRTDDLKKLEIGPSIVLNGTCFGAATHRLVGYGDANRPHVSLRTIDPTESFALQMLRRGSIGYIGGSASCSFGHVLPAITLLRDENLSLGQTLRVIQNGFIEPVPVEHWEAAGMKSGDPGFPKVDRAVGLAHPTMIQYTIRTICLGDPVFVPFPK